MAKVPFSDLVGKTFVAVKNHDGDEILFAQDNGDRFVQRHDQDCCERVEVAEIVGDLADLVGSPILQAEAAEHWNETPEGVSPPEHPDSYTWTFYRLATIKGSVTIRWLGESNGYYSESVDLHHEPA